MMSFSEWQSILFAISVCFSVSCPVQKRRLLEVLLQADQTNINLVECRIALNIDNVYKNNRNLQAVHQ